MSTENRKPAKKTTTLGINKIPKNVSVLDIAKAFSKLAKDISEIKIYTSKTEFRKALVSFTNVETCEKAKNMESIKLENEDFQIFYSQGFNNKTRVVASEDKIYVRYPIEERYDDIVKLVSKISTNVEVNKPEAGNNYFFATCSGIDEQCKLVKELNNKKVDGGFLYVKIAVDRSSARRHPAKANE